jgi:hypothetical protein
MAALQFFHGGSPLKHLIGRLGATDGKSSAVKGAGSSFLLQRSNAFAKICDRMVAIYTLPQK